MSSEFSIRLFPVSINHAVSSALKRLEFKVFWITGSTGDTMHQVAALESASQRKHKSKDIFLWIVFFPSWAIEYKYLMFPHKNIRIFSIPKHIHNIISSLIKAFPKTRMPIALNHLYGRDEASESSILGASSCSISSFKTSYEHALPLITNNLDPDHRLVWKNNKHLQKKVAKITGRISHNSILLNPVSHTHLGFAKNVWLSIAKRISEEGFIPVFTVGKSISRNSFGYIQLLETQALCGEHSYELLHTTPLELMVLGRYAHFSISGMGGSCNLVHDFRFDRRLKLGNEKNCMILWSTNQGKYSKQDNRNFLISDYGKAEQDIVFERHSQKDHTYRRFIHLTKRHEISKPEMDQISEALNQRTVN